MNYFELRISALAILAVLTPVPSLAAENSPEPGGVVMTDDGPTLVTPSGMTLYVHPADDVRPGHSACSNEPVREAPDLVAGFGKVPVPRANEAKSCAEKSPPYLAPVDAKPDGDWSVIDRPEGVKQWTYAGRPLYTSTRDHQPGDRLGLNVLESHFRVALASGALKFPPGLEVAKFDEDLVIATSKGHRPVYTPVSKRAVGCESCSVSLEPIMAAEVSDVSGDWLVKETAPGQKQYAFRLKLLFAPKEGTSARDIEETGNWEPVVFRKGSGIPPEITKRPTVLGDLYTTRSGKTLYVFECYSGLTGESGSVAGARCDEPGDPAQPWASLCKDGETCLKRWPLYLADRDARPRGNWTIIDVASPIFTDRTGRIYPPDVPRVKAWAYRGMPVYTYSLDEKPTDIYGHGVGNIRAYMTAIIVPGRGIAVR